MAKQPIPDHLLLQWHPTKNDDLDPKKLSSGSSQKVWWMGECGHEWCVQVHRRAKAGAGCPYCISKKALAGFNDLATTHPELVTEWHPTRNSSISPTELLAGSNVTVWWLGKCGHEWPTKLYTRGKGDSGCPYCSNQKVLVGFNDFATFYPELTKEWHPTKNDVLPTSITLGSSKTVWWLGRCGHEWRAQVTDRVNRKTGCRKCGPTGIYISLEDKYPELAAKFHPTKNSPIQLKDISYGSNKSLWWLGECGHEWKAPVTINKVLCSVCRNRKILPGLNDIGTTFPDIAAQWHPTKNGEHKITDFSKGSKFRAWWICEKGHEWSVQINDRTFYGSGCSQCSARRYTSKDEEVLATYIESLGLHIESSTRKIIHPSELDIYIPSKKIAIEFNGIYWHSELAGKDKDYHRNKWLACKEKDIQLIQIWEDEWNRNPEQIKRMLAHKLGVSNERKVFARKTVVAPITKAEVEVFLNENHVQGFASGSYYLGLKEKISDEIIAVLVLKKEAGTGGKVLNIIRYATSANVVGGFTKLLSFAGKTYKPESFITFADHCVSDGGLYENNGFIADKELPPDYMYISSNSRKHKFGYRLKRFRNDSGLLWEEGLTERELAELNGLVRVWDAGKTRYRKTL